MSIKTRISSMICSEVCQSIYEIVIRNGGSRFLIDSRLPQSQQSLLTWSFFCSLVEFNIPFIVCCVKLRSLKDISSLLNYSFLHIIIIFSYFSLGLVLWGFGVLGFWGDLKSVV